jgi:hypothetical protein
MKKWSIKICLITTKACEKIGDQNKFVPTKAREKVGTQIGLIATKACEKVGD